MVNLNKWYVEVRLSHLANNTINGIISLANKLEPLEVVFVYIPEPIKVPEHITSEFPDMQQVEDEKVMRELELLLSQKLAKNVVFKTELFSGKNRSDLFKSAETTDADLIVMSHDNAEDHTKIVKKAPCSVLFFPSQEEMELTDIQLPVDYSDFTALSMDVVKRLAEAYKVQKVNVVNHYKDSSFYLNGVFESPFEVNELFRQRQELDAKLSSYIDIKLNDFKEQNKDIENLEIEARKITKGADLAPLSTTEDIEKNIIIMGAEGTGTNSMVFRGILDQLVNSVKKPYVLILQKKSESKNFIKSLLRIA